MKLKDLNLVKWDEIDGGEEFNAGQSGILETEIEVDVEKLKDILIDTHYKYDTKWHINYWDEMVKQVVKNLPEILRSPK